MTDNSIVLQADGLYKVFGPRPDAAIRKLKDGADRKDLGDGVTAAVIDASFEVRKGEIFVVMGLSGSGKSTLIRMLNGLWEPSAGTVTLSGDPVTGVSKKRLRKIREERISMVFQHFALLPHRTVLDNVAYGLEIRKVPRAEREARALEVIGMVGLEGWERKYPGELSGGMQQRVGLGRALAADTEVLLMDEAFSALDPLIRRGMQQQLLELQATLGKTIVFITHDLNEAMFLGDRIAVMRDGRIVQVGTPQEILTEPANDYVEQFVADVDRARVLTAASVMERPLVLITESAGPAAALRAMRDAQTASAFVVDRANKLLGGIRDWDALELARRGVETLRDHVTETLRVTEDTVLADMFITATESTLPQAVVADDGRLLGVVPRVTLLAALGGETDADHEQTRASYQLPSIVIDTMLSSVEGEHKEVS